MVKRLTDLHIFKKKKKNLLRLQPLERQTSIIEEKKEAPKERKNPMHGHGKN